MKKILTLLKVRPDIKRMLKIELIAFFLYLILVAIVMLPFNMPKSIITIHKGVDHDIYYSFWEKYFFVSIVICAIMSYGVLYSFSKWVIRKLFSKKEDPLEKWNDMYRDFLIAKIAVNTAIEEQSIGLHPEVHGEILAKKDEAIETLTRLHTIMLWIKKYDIKRS